MGSPLYETAKRIALKFPSYRIQDSCRYSLDKTLAGQFKRLKPGLVLDTGARHSPYRKQIPHTSYMRLDIDPTWNPELLCSIYEIKCEPDYFDTVVSTELIEHLAEPWKAINEIHRVLKPGGVLILSTRFIFPYHAGPEDHYRFTKDSLAFLTREFSKREILPHGNRLQSIWDLTAQGAPGIIMRFFNPLIGRINFQDLKCVCGYVVRAEK